jgi:aspartokinase
MRTISKKCVVQLHDYIEEYRQVACVESKELDVTSLLIRLLALQSKQITKSDRQTLASHINDLINSELVFAQRMELEEAEIILVASMKILLDKN